MCDLDYGYMGFTKTINKIKGQTYQNLLSESKALDKYVYNSDTGEYTLTNPTVGSWNAMAIKYVRPIQAGENLLIRVNIIKNTIESTQSPPIKITYSDISSTTKGFINVHAGFTGLVEYYCSGAIINDEYKTKIDISTRNYTSGELVVKDIQVIPVVSNPLGSTELPTSINGIESVAENENNVLLLKDKSIQLPQPLRSLPNGVCDEVVGNKLIQRVGKIIVDGSENINLDKNSTNTIIYGIQVENCIVQSANIATQYPLCDKYTGIPQGLLWNNDVEGCSYSSHSDRKIRISILKSKLSDETVSAFINYISQNPIILYYELATPIEHTISVNIKKIKKSKCYNKIKPTII